METLISLAVGIGLSAACGFRVFVPLLAAGIAARAGHLELGAGTGWIESTPALLAFAAATGLEIAAYYIPWLDNLLDAVATPAAVIAATLLTGAVAGDLSPLLRWSLAVIGGGGTAALVQGGTVALRSASSAATGGVGNFLVSTAEWIVSVLTAMLALLAPLIALILLVTAFLLLRRRIGPRFGWSGAR